jgi:hypothetical protein
MTITRMHEQSYITHIHRILMQYGSVSIDGLGTLSISRTPATFADGHTTIFPPNTSLKWSQDYIADYSLSRLLSEDGWSSDSISGLQQLLQLHLNEGKLDLSPLGSFSDKTWTSGQSEVINAYHGLDNVNSTPLPYHVDRYYRPNPILDTPIVKTPVKEEALPFYLPLFLLAVMGLTIFMAFQSYKQGKNADQTEPLRSYAYKPLRLQEESSNSILQQVDSMLSEKPSKPKNLDVAPEKVAFTKVNPPQKDVQNSKLQAQNKSISEVSVVTSEDRSCVIIIGAFKEQSNASRLIQKIKRKGYQVYSSNDTGLQRVGVKYDCKAINPDSFKAKIQTAFDKNAWDLKDNL